MKNNNTSIKFTHSHECANSHSRYSQITLTQNSTEELSLSASGISLNILIDSFPELYFYIDNVKDGYTISIQAFSTPKLPENLESIDSKSLYMYSYLNNSLQLKNSDEDYLIKASFHDDCFCNIDFKQVGLLTTFIKGVYLMHLNYLHLDGDNMQNEILNKIVNLLLEEKEITFKGKENTTLVKNRVGFMKQLMPFLFKEKQTIITLS